MSEKAFGSVPTYVLPYEQNIEVRRKVNKGWVQTLHRLKGYFVGIVNGNQIMMGQSINSVVVIYDINEHHKELYTTYRLPELYFPPVVNDNGTILYYLNAYRESIIYNLMENKIVYKSDESLSGTGPFDYFFIGDNYLINTFENTITIGDVRNIDTEPLLFHNVKEAKRLGYNSFVFYDMKSREIKIVKVGPRPLGETQPCGSKICTEPSRPLSEARTVSVGLSVGLGLTLDKYHQQIVDSAHSGSLDVYSLDDKYIIKNHDEKMNSLNFWIYDPIKNTVKEYEDNCSIFISGGTGVKKYYRITPLKNERVKAENEMSQFLSPLLKISKDLAKVVSRYTIY